MKLDRHINLRIPASIHAVLASRARATGATLSDAVRSAVERGIGHERSVGNDEKAN